MIDATQCYLSNSDVINEPVKMTHAKTSVLTKRSKRYEDMDSAKYLAFDLKLEQTSESKKEIVDEHQNCYELNKRPK